MGRNERGRVNAQSSGGHPLRRLWAESGAQKMEDQRMLMKAHVTQGRATGRPLRAPE